MTGASARDFSPCAHCDNGLCLVNSRLFAKTLIYFQSRLFGRANRSRGFVGRGEYELPDHGRDSRALPERIPSTASYAARFRLGRTTARTANNSRSAALTLDESGKAFASSASRIRARRPRRYGFRRALDQSFTSGISRRDAADGSFAFVRFAFMGSRFPGANDPDDFVCLQLNIHDEKQSCPG
jgi:hypothetical protein